jgi:hypothetical protein
MPTPRKYATPAERQAAYRARRHVSTASLPLPPPVPGYRRWAVMLSQTQGMLEQVAEEMTTYWDERSEAWQVSERGDQFTERLEALEEILTLLRELAEA